MAQNNKISELTELLEPVVAQAGLFLEQVRLVRAGKYSTLQVTVDLPDGPGGVDSDKIAEVTRAVSGLLDQADPIAGSYTLEVSTPGAERELTSARHFSRTIGRTAQVTLLSGEEISGAVSAADAAGAVIAGQRVEYEEISKAYATVEFGKSGREAKK
ncbi:MAG: ribosome maturation factor RimP [Trueperella sp.]|nr:ribosome maturation factor RimP [Trueperella sp.]